jgi:hypothetical protein
MLDFGVEAQQFSNCIRGKGTHPVPAKELRGIKESYAYAEKGLLEVQAKDSLCDC